MTGSEFIIASGILAATSALVTKLILFSVKRKADKKDANEQEAKDNLKQLFDDMAEKIDDLQFSVEENSTYFSQFKVEYQENQKAIYESFKAILQDRIRYLGSTYLKDGEVSFIDRGDLIKMHKVYHDSCGGNGNLDELMRDMMELPLTDTKRR